MICSTELDSCLKCAASDKIYRRPHSLPPYFLRGTSTLHTCTASKRLNQFLLKRCCFILMLWDPLGDADSCLTYIFCWSRRKCKGVIRKHCIHSFNEKTVCCGAKVCIHAINASDNISSSPYMYHTIYIKSLNEAIYQSIVP